MSEPPQKWPKSSDKETAKGYLSSMAVSPPMMRVLPPPPKRFNILPLLLLLLLPRMEPVAAVSRMEWDAMMVA